MSSRETADPGEAMFYHLTARALEAALPELLERALERGWRSVVRCGTPARVEALNLALWTYRDDTFLPHGAAADGRAGEQPIYLTAEPEVPNAADVLFAVDGAEVDPREARAFARVCVLFDGRDEAAVAQARGMWRAMTAAGVKAAYWAQDDAGKWRKKA